MSAITPNFLDFWVFITDQLGDTYGLVNPKVKTKKELFNEFDDQHGLLKEVLLQCYRLNKCHHIKSPIDINLVLDVLGEKAFELQLKQADDLLDIELLEEICWLISQHYSTYISTPTFSKDESKDEALSSSVVISLPKTKIKIANSKL